MVSPRRLLGGVAVCSAAVVLSAMLAGSASAAPNGCQNENSGANGQTCTNVGSDLYPGVVAGLHLKLPVHVGATVNVPSCPDATASLVQAHLIVGGINGKGGTARRLASAVKEDASAHAELAAAVTADTNEDADTKPDAEDSAVIAAGQDVTTAEGNLAAAKAADTAEDAGPPVKTDPVGPGDPADQLVTQRTTELATAQGVLKTKQNADAAEDGNGVAETPSDPADAKLAAAHKKADSADKELTNAQNAEGAAEQGIVDAEVVIGQACKTPVVTPPAPAPPTDTPAPAPSEPVVISPALPSDGSAPTPVPVQASLPVTG